MDILVGYFGRYSFRRCVLYRKTLSEIYGEIMRDGVSESNRPLFSAPSIMLISIAARLMEEGVSAPNVLSFSLFLSHKRFAGGSRDVHSTVHNALDLQLLQIHSRSLSIPSNGGVVRRRSFLPSFSRRNASQMKSRFIVPL